MSAPELEAEGEATCSCGQGQVPVGFCRLFGKFGVLGSFIYLRHRAPAGYLCTKSGCAVPKRYVSEAGLSLHLRNLAAELAGDPPVLMPWVEDDTDGLV